MPRRRPCVCLALAAAAAAAAQAEPAAGVDDGPALRLELSPSAPASPAGADGRASVEQATQTVLWNDRAHWSMGLGVEQRWRQPLAGGPGGPGGPGLRLDGQNLLVGLSVPTGAQSRLAWQLPVADPRSTEAPMRVSWSFRPSDPYRELFRGSLLKLEFSGQTALSLRARGGRLGLMLTSRW